MLGRERDRELDVGQRGQHQHGQPSITGNGGLMGNDADPPACQGVNCEFDTVDAGKHLRALSQRRNEDQTDQERSDEWCKRTHAGHHREFCPQRNYASREPPQSFHPMYSPSAHQALRSYCARLTSIGMISTPNNCPMLPCAASRSPNVVVPSGGAPPPATSSGTGSAEWLLHAHRVRWCGPTATMVRSRRIFRRCTS